MHGAGDTHRLGVPSPPSPIRPRAGVGRERALPVGAWSAKRTTRAVRGLLAQRFRIPPTYFGGGTVNASKLAQFIGRVGEIDGPGELVFEVQVQDARERLGSLEFLVTPRSGGHGAAWVPAPRVRLEPHAQVAFNGKIRSGRNLGAAAA